MILHRLFILSITFCCTTLVSGNEPDKECQDWFNRSKIESGSQGCELRCSSLMTDMSSFICPNQCNILCGQKKEVPILAKFIYYPGLTPSENELVIKYPKDSITVFVQKTRAEWASTRLFPTQELNDEGDAFRHYIWAGLLTKEIGKDQALKFLNAHEENRLQPSDEQEMDLSNNQSGILAAENLIKIKEFSLENLERRALNDLRAKNLKVISPGLPIPKEPL